MKPDSVNDQSNEKDKNSSSPKSKLAKVESSIENEIKSDHSDLDSTLNENENVETLVKSVSVDSKNLNNLEDDSKRSTPDKIETSQKNEESML